MLNRVSCHLQQRPSASVQALSAHLGSVQAGKRPADNDTEQLPAAKRTHLAPEAEASTATAAEHSQHASLPAGVPPGTSHADEQQPDPAPLQAGGLKTDAAAGHQQDAAHEQPAADNIAAACASQAQVKAEAASLEPMIAEPAPDAEITLPPGGCSELPAAETGTAEQPSALQVGLQA